LKLQPKLPIRAKVVRFLHIVKGLGLSVDGLLANLEHASNATSKWNSPFIVAIRLPVRIDDR